MVFLAMLILSACAPAMVQSPVQQLSYAGQARAGHYRNPAAGFEVRFGQHWHVATRPDQANPEFQHLWSQFEEEELALLLLAYPASFLYFTRITVEPVNLAMQDYFEIILEVNRGELLNYESPSWVRTGNNQALKWEFITSDGGGNTIRNLEYQLKEGSNNIRITFGADERFFHMFESEFERVINSYRTL